MIIIIFSFSLDLKSYITANKKLKNINLLQKIDIYSIKSHIKYERFLCASNNRPFSIKNCVKQSINFYNFSK